MIKNWKLFSFLNGEKIELEDVIHIEISRLCDQLKIEIIFKKNIEISELYLDFKFDQKITHWRYLDYTWKIVGAKPLVANVHSPKILQLSSGQRVVAKNTQGCWEYRPTTNSLRWYFYHPMLTPTMVYDDSDKRQFLTSQKIAAGKVISTGFLWTDKNVEEWGRTPLGFLPIVCFTDHSDFDVTASLIKQRELFEKCNIRVTKGFFLYNYTHKKENANFETHDSRKELICWKKDGHEMAYHALSQSYRGEISEKEFESFETPLELSPINCYIDHGFHPYNYTKQKLGCWNRWYEQMKKKEVRLIWNYIDSGVAHSLNGNQINPLGFTKNNVIKSFKINKSLGFNRAKSSCIKNILLFSTEESFLLELKKVSDSLYKFRKEINTTTGKTLLSDIITVTRYAFNPKIIFNYIFYKNKVFDLARFGPVFFPAPNQNESNIQVFQSVLVNDFDIVFSDFSLKNFKTEKGVMIAHTYFGDYRQNHEGRLFENEELELRIEATQALERLGFEIQNQNIWNPTISELYLFFQNFENLYYEFEDGNLVVKNFIGVTRNIKNA